jgi:hypothetical protein
MSKAHSCDAIASTQTYKSLNIKTSELKYYSLKQFKFCMLAPSTTKCMCHVAKWSPNSCIGVTEWNFGLVVQMELPTKNVH